jgi:NAD-dependent SIR2 family protein deacetylase
MTAVSVCGPDMAGLDKDAIARAAQLISGADSLVVAAGAGMGVDSGLPDYRGNAGFWTAYPALGNSHTAFIEIASPKAFAANARRAWGFYGHRLDLYRKTVPHAGFELLRKWGSTMEHGSFVFTSNVDGQFQKAGIDPYRVDECHGSIHVLQCMKPCTEMVWPAAAFLPVVDEAHCELVGAMPTCPRCGGLARPNILMFNDSGYIAERHGRQAVRFQSWVEHVRRPVIVEIGAGVNIRTVRTFSHRTVLQHQGSLIRINPREPDIGSLPGVGIASGALQTLAAIDALLRPKSGRVNEPFNNASLD